MSIKWLHKDCQKKYLELEHQLKKEITKNKAIISIIENNNTLKALFLEEKDKNKNKKPLEERIKEIKIQIAQEKHDKKANKKKRKNSNNGNCLDKDDYKIKF